MSKIISRVFVASAIAAVLLFAIALSAFADGGSKKPIATVSYSDRDDSPVAFGGILHSDGTASGGGRGSGRGSPFQNFHLKLISWSVVDTGPDEEIEKVEICYLVTPLGPTGPEFPWCYEMPVTGQPVLVDIDLDGSPEAIMRVTLVG